MMHHRRIRLLTVLFSVCLLFLLSGCYVSNPIGLRELGVYAISPMAAETRLVAIDEMWPMGGPKYYISTDGGFSWSIDESTHYQDPSYQKTLTLKGDCLTECELWDAYQKQIFYRIRPGKVLEMSVDGMKTWQEQVRVETWSLMQQNYSKASFADMGSTPKEVRGPFSAVTDPKTGNLVVAMGMEGILLRTNDNAWHWVSFAAYKKVQPTRIQMLSLISVQEWARGAFIFLVFCTAGFMRAGLARYRRTSGVFVFLGALLIVLPFQTASVLLRLLFSLLYLDGTEAVYRLFFWGLPLFVFAGLLWLVLLALQKAWTQNRVLVNSLVVIALCSILGHWLAFLFWSQGILFTEYEYATIAGLVILVIGFIIIIRTTPRPTSLTNPPILESSNP